jgi:hypothetical protein
MIGANFVALTVVGMHDGLGHDVRFRHSMPPADSRTRLIHRRPEGVP